eukprot:4093968-Lingulodinium_polyedra.AAC.1
MGRSPPVGLPWSTTRFRSAWRGHCSRREVALRSALAFSRPSGGSRSQRRGCRPSAPSPMCSGKEAATLSTSWTSWPGWSRAACMAR